jgi:hypothetical protein
MQHEPDRARLVEAHLDEVVAAAQGAEVLVVVGLLQLRVVAADRPELRLELRPGSIDRGRRLAPGAGSRSPARDRAEPRSIAVRSGASWSGRSSARSVVLQAIMPQPMSTPTAAG